MATVTLDRLWINLASTGEAISAKHQMMPEESWENEGEVRTFAGGRQRAISKEGESGTFSFVILGVTETTWLKLRTWKTLAVEVRDPRGRQFFGIYLSVKKTRTYPINVCTGEYLYDVGITLQTITFDEGG